MKLALCLFTYFPYGGLQRNFLTIAQELLSRGHQIDIYTRSWEGEYIDGLNVYLMPSTGLSNHTKNEKFHADVCSSLIENPVDLVVGFNKIPDLDVYYCADTCFATKVFEDKPWWYRLLPRARSSLRFEYAVFEQNAKTEVLLLSAKEGEAFHKYYSTNQERLHLMPPGISRTRIKSENSEITRKAVRNQLGFSESDKVIAFLGSDYKRKGLDRLLKAVSALPEKTRESVHVLVIGRDKRLPSYVKLSEKLHIKKQVHFVGQRDDVPDLLSASDCLAHPAYLENTGNVILEALISGLPVICSGTCGYAFYVEENNVGYVIAEPYQQKMMNIALQNLLKALTVDAEVLSNRLADFALNADIYSRPQKAADCIEWVYEKKQSLQIA